MSDNHFMQFNDSDELSLHKLKVRELNSFLKHVKLGQPHLKRKLSKSDFHKLLKTVSLNTRQEHSIKTDKQEKAGNISLVLNTIVTSCLGGWLGLAGFTHYSLHSLFTVFVVILTVVIGGWIGYLSYQLTSRQASEAIVDQKLANCQIDIIHEILAKKNKTSTRLKNKIKQLINFCADKDLFVEGSQIDFMKMLSPGHSDSLVKVNIQSFLKKIADPEITEFYQQKFSALTEAIEHNVKSYSAHMTTEPHTPKKVASDLTEANVLVTNTLTNPSYIKVLTKPDTPSRKQITRIDAWLKTNLLAIGVGLLPTVLGGFASMFVFLNGLPEILAHFHFVKHIDSQMAFYCKIFGITSAFLLTVYFGYSHIHTNFKAFKRAQELERSEDKVAHLEEQVQHLNIAQQSLLKIRHQLVQLQQLFQTLKFMTRYVQDEKA
jgi:hypothetical protein